MQAVNKIIECVRIYVVAYIYLTLYSIFTEKSKIKHHAQDHISSVSEFSFDGSVK